MAGYDKRLGYADVVDPTADRLITGLRESGYGSHGPPAVGSTRLRIAVWGLWARVGELIFERGTDTRRMFVDPHHFVADRVWYVPSSWWTIRKALRRQDVSASDVFVDFGSGKGRVVLAAARLPFKRVLGVEVSPYLGQLARRNLERARDRVSAQSVEIVTCDAADFPVPDDMTFAYFSHPFTGETFSRVVDGIVASLARRPRRLRIIYAIPIGEAELLSRGCFSLVRSFRIRDGSRPQRLAIYEARP